MPADRYVQHTDGPCFESCGFLSCNRDNVVHTTHEARAGNGRVLKRWKVRREIEEVPVTQGQLWEGE